MFTVIETWHKDNGAWGNIHHECMTETEALWLASMCDPTSTVEIKDEDWQTVLALTSPQFVEVG